MARSPLAWALYYAELGWPVLPLHSPRDGECSCGKPLDHEGSPAKHPRTRHGVKDATTDSTQIRRWWKQWPDANVGIAMGSASGVSALDHDLYKGGSRNGLGKLPSGPVMVTGGGELRYLYRHPKGLRPSVGQVAEHVDVQAEGSYIVASPSVHASGGRYRWKKGPTTPLKPFPRFAAANGAEPGRNALTSSDHGSSVGKGSRHDALKLLAVAMRLTGAPTDIVEQGLFEANKRFDPPLGEDRYDEIRRLARDSEKWDLSHEARLARKIEDLKVLEEARTILAAERAGPAFELPEVDRTLSDSLKEPRSKLKYTVDKLHTVGGNTLLVARYKTGKTVLLMNLAKALADGTPFLDKFDVEELTGRVAPFNYELTKDMFLEGVEDLGIDHPERIAEPLHLRGRSLRLWDKHVMEHVISWLKENEVQFWLIDPAARAWRGLVEREGDNVQIDAFTSALDEIKERAGVTDLVLTTHMGREKVEDDEERARGGTRLEDWMDHGWYMGKDGKTQDSPRWFRAMGRDVDLDAIALDWDPTRRLVTASGKSRSERREDVGIELILDALFLAEKGDEKELTSTELQEQTGFTKDTISKPRGAAEREGLISVRDEGKGKPKFHSLTDKGRERIAGSHVVVVGDGATTTPE